MYCRLLSWGNLSKLYLLLKIIIIIIIIIIIQSTLVNPTYSVPTLELSVYEGVGITG